MEKISDKDTVKKKKRRKRKNISSSVKTTATKKENVVLTKEKVSKDIKTSNVKGTKTVKKEEKSGVICKIFGRSHEFSIQSLVMTILFALLVVLIFLASYLIGLFDSLQDDKVTVDFGIINSIEINGVTVNLEGYEFVIPAGYIEVDSSESLLKISNIVTGISFEIDSIIKDNDLYSDKSIDKYRKDLTNNGFNIYSSYVYDDQYGKYLVFSGIDEFGDEYIVVYGTLDNKKVVKIDISSDYDEVSDEIYETIFEILGN